MSLISWLRGQVQKIVSLGKHPKVDLSPLQVDLMGLQHLGGADYQRDTSRDARRSSAPAFTTVPEQSINTWTGFGAGDMDIELPENLAGYSQSINQEPLYVNIRDYLPSMSSESTDTYRSMILSSESDAASYQTLSNLRGHSDQYDSVTPLETDSHLSGSEPVYDTVPNNYPSAQGQYDVVPSFPARADSADYQTMPDLPDNNTATPYGSMPSNASAVESSPYGPSPSTSDKSNEHASVESSPYGPMPDSGSTLECSPYGPLASTSDNAQSEASNHQTAISDSSSKRSDFKSDHPDAKLDAEQQHWEQTLNDAQGKEAKNDATPIVPKPK